MTEQPENTTISCCQCGAPLVCGAVNGQATCWCAALPNVMPLPEKAASCYCRECLEKLVEGRTIKPRKLR